LGNGAVGERIGRKLFDVLKEGLEEAIGEEHLTRIGWLELENARLTSLVAKLEAQQEIWWAIGYQACLWKDYK
jgi:hypothetical protein